MLRFLMFLLRVVFGTVFIISGFFKFMDPIGTGLKVTEYLNSMHLGFLSFGSDAFGMCLSILEFVVGIAIFMRLRMRCASFVGLCMTCFFTILTLFLALFNPISDCGCFGEAIHLTNWQTFFKNLVLLVCIIPVFLFRKKFRRVAPAPAEWAFIGIYGLIGITATLYFYITIPKIEFGEFKTGTNISLKLDDVSENKEFETVFIYEKDDLQKEFTLDDLPDSTWTYVDTRSDISEEDMLDPFDFAVTDIHGDYITESITETEVPQVLFVVKDPSSVHFKRWNRISEAVDALKRSGYGVYVLTPGYDAVIDSQASVDNSIMNSLAFSDSKTLISLCRSNGGAVYLNDGLVVRKWAGNFCTADRILESIEEDPDDVVIHDNIMHRLVYEISILFIFLSIVVFRYVCGIIYGRKPKIV